MSEAFDLTDPATELAGLWEWLSATEGGEPAFTVMERLFAGEANSVDLSEVLSVIGQRIRRLVKFAHSVDDPFITDRVRKNLIKHLNKMSLMFAPNQITQPWHDYKSKFINEDQLTTLESVSSRVRTHQPLKLISEEDRINLIERIGEILEADNFSEIPG